MKKFKSNEHETLERIANENAAPLTIDRALQSLYDNHTAVEIEDRVHLTAIELTYSINFAALSGAYDFEVDRIPEHKLAVGLDEYNLQWDENVSYASLECWFDSESKSNCFIIEYDWENAAAYCVSVDDYFKCFEMYVELNKETKAEFNAEAFINLTKQNAKVFKTSINDLYNAVRLYRALKLDEE